ncbi:hypothetical protein JKI95_10065 [Corynebacterium aquatimens]|uniref:hypothetical protein n=1 Tax=Corynebacterium aquatimens TaxID=1190508 RepID=UPI0025411458|nr:hypothetical protein [Corynebacterium aquatimens]QYH19426.1 hypothetical protein JKI95_10065 [Corynebacterium aquatimens]
MPGDEDVLVQGAGVGEDGDVPVGAVGLDALELAGLAEAVCGELDKRVEGGVEVGFAGGGDSCSTSIIASARIWSRC